ncbi:MAG: mismatch-specific glycosylase [Bacilli bacterium]|nr:mismatch-specific glycosylase [Bacilli bacterium]
MQVTSFSWIANKFCNKIILGSMPGIESLRQQQYYAHPRNQFWPLIYALCDQKPDQEYGKRIQFVLSQRIALWDVISHCERVGSLDSNIQKPIMNNFELLFSTFPDIQTIYFNGAKAYDLFMKNISPALDLSLLAFHKLPSSSPAHTLSFANKWAAWSAIRV